MSGLRHKAGAAKRRLSNAKRELFPPSGGSSGAQRISARSVTPGRFADEPDDATRRIHARLSEADLAAIAAAIEADSTMIDYPVPPGAPPRQVALTDGWAEAGGVDRMRLDLIYGTYFAVPAVLEKTGLSTATPPAEIHAMSHSALAAGGAFYHADLVSNALATCGAPIASGQRILDFGCSSGRVTRALRAAYPEAELFGCDPNAPAIEWAADNLPGIEFSVSQNNPPLPYPDDQFDAAFGISIWSHFNEQLALDWYDEMWRILRPGGHLVSTTHGAQSVAFYGSLNLRSSAQLAEIKQSLYADGYWYAAEFGDKGDWGVVNSDWGTSFVAAEWMLERLCPKWQVVEFATARNESNQDVYVLRKN